MNRRHFMASAAGAAALAGAGLRPATSIAQDQKKQAVLKLASQEGRIPGGSLAEKVRKLQDWGGVGLEVGGGGLQHRVKEIKDALKGTNVKMSAICAGFRGVPISHDPEVRKQAIESSKVILTAAGELESTGMIIVPAFNGQTELNNKEGRKILLEEVLPQLGDHAVKCGTRVLLEPLNRRECFFLRLLADAAAICRDANHPGVCMMGDFYHMCIEETSDWGAFLSAGKYCHHVHLASRARNLPGQDDRSFVDGFKGLKMIGYQDYCSLECGCKGDPNVEIPKSFRLLEQQWAEAVI